MIGSIDKNTFRKKGTRIIMGILASFLVSYLIRMNFAVTYLLISLTVYMRFRKLDYKLLNLILLFLITFVSGYFILKKDLPVYLYPFSAVPMLLTVLFNNLELTLLMAVATSISLASFSQNPMPLATLFLIGGIFSSILVLGARQAKTIRRAGLLIGVVLATSLFFMERFAFNHPLRYLFLVLNGYISSGIVLLLTPVFETLFETITNISLLELSDFNHPLLRRMALEAPGTYNHCLVAGNLAETASEAVGANSLLARIGAYYHDIGKLQKPDYFSENQDIGSRHDTLSPSMSKLIIMNHVKEGVELAKKYRLKPVIIDFIQQHHANSLVFYFYQRALESLEEDREIKEEGFRYPGPKPNTKETAIVLLADSVEAATRALKEPDSAKIEEVVHKIINNKFIDGQLDECDLTLKDLEKIAAVFIRVLGGIYHGRVTYPHDARSENNHKKPSKEDPNQSEKDKFGNS